MAPRPLPSGTLRPTRLGVAFLGLILVTLVGCINYALGLGYAVTFLLGGVWVAAAAQATRAGRNLTGRVTPPTSAVAGGTAPFTVRVESRGPELTVLVRLGPGAEGMERVPAGGRAEVTVPLPTPTRGLLSLTRPAVAALDPLGLWAVWQPLPVPAPLPVSPVLEEGAPPPPPAPGTGEETERRGPGPDDFSGLRPYQPGDSPRQVSWRHVARTGALVVRETDAPAGTLLALDWAQTAALPDPEARLSRLAAWVEEARRTGAPFRLSLPGCALPPSAGEAHAAAARAALAEVQPWPAPAATSPRRPAPAPLPGAPLRFTLLALAFALAPAALRQPMWLTGLEAALLGYAALRTHRPLPAPPSWALGLLAGLGFVVLNAVYSTLLGREAGTALLGLLVCLKAAETRTRRDARLLALLGVFVLLTHLFFGQGPLAAAHVALGLVGLLAALGRWNGPGPESGLGAVGRAARLGLQAAPLMVVLFVVFPRPDGPLWQLPVQAAQTGLADEITAGEYSSLAQSRDVAFRAEFGGPLPGPEERYWRGPVYERYDGVRWGQVRERFESPTVEFSGPTLAYRLTLEPGNPPWIPVLDTPTTLPPGAFLTTAFQAVSFSVGGSRTRHAVQGRAARLGAREAQGRLTLNLGLPSGESPQARALAASWAGLPAPERVEAALAWLRAGDFRYTLTPPTLPERDRVDAFLFGSRAGFCEHYASSFAFLMRASGVPARVVGGYLGGELNPDGGYLIVRQQDAHAWAEVWLEGRGWVRVDPTAQVAPGRVTAGLPTALARPGAEAALPPAALDRVALRVDAWQTRWNNWVAGYDGPRQRDLLGRVEAGVGGRPALLALGVAGMLLAALPLLLVARRRSPAPDPAARLLDDLARCLHLPRAPAETAAAYGERAIERHPEQADAIRAAVGAYHRARYGGEERAVAELRAVVKTIRGR